MPPANNSLPRVRMRVREGAFTVRLAGGEEAQSPLGQDEGLVVWQTLTLQNKTEGGLHG